MCRTMYVSAALLLKVYLKPQNILYLLFILTFQLLTIPILTRAESTEDGQRRQLSDVQSQLQSMQFEIQNIKTNYSRHETLISSRTTKLRNLEAKLEYQVPLINRATNQIPKMSKGSGTVYIRWGKESCSQNSTKIYSGYAAGSGYTETGSSGKTLCLSPDPLWSFPEPATRSYEVSHIFGSEYEFDLFSQHISNEDIPCTVCMSQHGSEVLMIPGRNRCYGDWTEEYRGFLLGPYASYHSLDYICIDEYPDTLPGGSTDANGRLFNLVETQCSSLKCPPYENQKIVTCVVCSK